jgi:hypothetical protein
MALKIYEDSYEDDILLNEMRDGQIGIITNWDQNPKYYIKRIVQRYKDDLITLGENSSNSFEGIFNNTSLNNNYRVKILPPGTKFKLVYIGNNL